MTAEIVLDALDFERTLRLSAEVRIAELEAERQLARAKAAVDKARAARAAHFQALATRYPGLQAEDAQYDVDEATRTLRLRQP